MALIEFNNVSKAYGSKSAVMNFSLQINEAERIVILGPSGCGKTTVLRLLAGFIPPDTGRILSEGQIISDGLRIVRQPEERRLGMVFQDLALWPHLTVRGNLELGLKARAIPEGERRERVQRILEMVELAALLDARPGELSGGQQQRVALARALVLEPKALLMDEPLSSLDLELNIRLRKKILELHEKLGFSLLYITHDREEALALGSRIVIMREGRIERIGRETDISAYFTELARQAEGSSESRGVPGPPKGNGPPDKNRPA